MGEVYRAGDTKLNRNVALKVLPEVLAHDPERMARFKREAQVLAALNHPNIATIYGFEESDGVYALAMELVEGQTLADRQHPAQSYRCSSVCPPIRGACRPCGDRLDEPGQSRRRRVESQSLVESTAIVARERICCKVEQVDWGGWSDES